MANHKSYCWIIALILWTTLSSFSNANYSEPLAQFPLTEAHGGSDVTCYAPNVTFDTEPQWGSGPQLSPAGALYLSQSMGAFLPNIKTNRLVSFASSESMFFYVNVKDEGSILDLCAIKFYAEYVYSKFSTRRRLFLKTRMTDCTKGVARSIRRNKWYHIGITFAAETRTLRVYIDGREMMVHSLSKAAVASVYSYFSLGAPILACPYCTPKKLQPHADHHALVSALTFFSSELSPTEISELRCNSEDGVWSRSPGWPQCLPRRKPPGHGDHSHEYGGDHSSSQEEDAEDSKSDVSIRPDLESDVIRPNLFITICVGALMFGSLCVALITCRILIRRRNVISRMSSTQMVTVSDAAASVGPPKCAAAENVGALSGAEALGLDGAALASNLPPPAYSLRGRSVKTTRPELPPEYTPQQGKLECEVIG